MNNSKLISASILLLLTILLLGCSSQTAQSSTVEESITASLTNIPSPTSTPSPSPTSTAIPFVHQSDVEVVTNTAVTGDGGNNWGGHQSRIVHTQDGVFTAYTVETGNALNRNWKLAQRNNDGTWVVVAEGISGREPVNLLASPDGTLHVIGWPGGVATMWSGKPDHGTLMMEPERIPNVSAGDWPYSSAGTDANGDLCALSSEGGWEPIGWFKWACYIPGKNQWITQSNKFDARFAYTYVFPKPDGQLSLVSTRDVEWAVLGYKQPENTFGYVFNAFGYWRTNDIVSTPIEVLSFAEEAPTEKYPNVFLNAQLDAYLDTTDRMHILYTLMGSSSGGESTVRHRIVAPDGTTLFDEELPQEAGSYVRIFQNKKEDFYLLGSFGLLYPMDAEGMKLGDPITLDFGRYQVEYSGFGLSVPRTGTPLSDVMDVVFPSSNGASWIYFQLDFSDLEGNSTVQAAPSAVPQEGTSPIGSFQTLLDNAQLLFTADLRNPAMSGWDWWDEKHSVVASESGTLIFNENKIDGAQIHSQYGLQENEACLMLYRYGGDPDFIFTAVYGNWWDATWRSWGINQGADNYLQANDSQGQDSNYYSLGLRGVPDRWYYLLLWVKDSSTFFVRVWEKDNPLAFGERQFNMSDTSNWSDREWNCHLLINSGTLEMGSYQELRFKQMP